MRCTASIRNCGLGIKGENQGTVIFECQWSLPWAFDGSYLTVSNDNLSLSMSVMFFFDIQNVTDLLNHGWLRWNNDFIKKRDAVNSSIHFDSRNNLLTGYHAKQKHDCVVNPLLKQAMGHSPLFKPRQVTRIEIAPFWQPQIKGFFFSWVRGSYLLASTHVRSWWSLCDNW